MGDRAKTSRRIAKSPAIKRKSESAVVPIKRKKGTGKKK